MPIKVGMENNTENRSIAWVLDFPGCFAYGSNETEALIRVPQALIAFKNWLDGYTSTSWLKDLGDFDIRLTEAFECYSIDADLQPDPKGDYEVNAWFHHDWLPLTATDIEQGLQVIEWAHNDLREMVAALTDAQLDQTFPGERWSVRGILGHVANAEWWYLDRLSLADGKREELPDAVLPRMQATLDNLQRELPKLTSVNDVRGRRGELWSPRKILRRSCWHALDHAQHIHKLITQL